MSKRKLWVPKAFDAPKGLQADPPSNALEIWSKQDFISASGENGIEIFGIIGDDPWMEGFALKDMSAALGAADGADVTVAINSPGGSFFDGVAIYNMLREYKGSVTVNVLGIAASAASVIVMAGDEIVMHQSARLMIHNSWGMVVGNRNELSEAADLFALFDYDMAQIYAMRSGKTVDEVQLLMDEETFLSAQDAVDMGFADHTSGEKQAKNTAKTPSNASAKRHLESILAKNGMPRTERRKLMRELTGTPSAADEVMPSADEWPLAEMQNLLETFKV